MKTNSFNTQESAVIDVQATCQILFTHGDSGRVIVGIDASEEDIKKFEVYQRNNTVYVRQTDFKDGSGSVTTFVGGNIISGDFVEGNIFKGDVFSGRRNVRGGGGSFITSGRGNVNVTSGGRNVQIINGRVIVDGKDVTDGGNGDIKDAPVYKIPKIVIHAPAGSNLVAELAGEARLNSIVELDDLSLTCSHSAQAEIDKAHSADIDTQNGSSVSVNAMTGGALNVNTANGSEVRIKGVWSQAVVVASNGSSVKTAGTCNGGYNATGNNSATIRHSGSVKGRVREKENNSSSVNIG